MVSFSEVSAEESARAEKRIILELGARHLLVMLHGLLLAEVGIVMALFGVPPFLVDLLGHRAHLLLGLPALAIGLLVFVGAWVTDDTRLGWWMQVIGLPALVAWEAVMAALYGILVFSQGIPPLVGLDATGLGEVSGRAYVPLIYTNILALAMVHAWTLLCLGRPPR